MNFYPLARQALFHCDAEFSHNLALKSFRLLQKLGRSHWFGQPLPLIPQTVMGINFPNPVGLAAGLDKNAECIDVWGAMGFGFVEVGTVTPKPQPGNPKPRLFRLKEHQAIINRMGFNNQGVDNLINNVQQSRYQGILGINIGKNFDTPVSDAASDYKKCMQKVYPFAHYIVVNISSPNTPNLRKLQFGDALNELLDVIKNEQDKLATQHRRSVPVAVKIAPDLEEQEIEQLAATFNRYQLDAIIATNTTNDRVAIKGHPLENEAGGLSGKPVFKQSTHVIQRLRKAMSQDIPIIGVGGIHSAKDADDKFEAGADLVQLYTGFIYEGPKLISSIITHLKEKQTLSNKSV